MARLLSIERVIALLSGRRGEQAQERIAKRTGTRRGFVWLVGAGPGDADLMTLRAARLLAGADVVVHDRLVSAEALGMVSANTRLVDVGKRRGDHRMDQCAINDLLVRLAREGRRVVRLKGGDPLIFGRGGEEAQALARAGVDYEIVPGVTAASACAAGARIPLTQRGVSSACLFLTGHAHTGGPDLDWSMLARTRHTLAIYMGLHTLPRIVAGLITHGRDPATPAALVERGGTAAQRVVSATLATLVAEARDAEVTGPALLVIGEVVALRPSLHGLPGLVSDEAFGVKEAVGEAA